MGLNKEGKNRREDWGTPQWLFDYLDKIFKFQVDLAATTENTKCEQFVCNSFFANDPRDFDQVSCWCNPPYGREHNASWAWRLMQYQNIVVLHQASVGAKWFQPFWEHANFMIFLDERLCFDGAPNKAQFDSVIIIKWEMVPYDKMKHFQLIGNVVTRSDGIYAKRDF